MTAGRPGAVARHRARDAFVALVAVVLLGTAPAASAAGARGIGGRIRVSPLLVSLELSTGRAQAGQTVQARATVSNLGKILVKKVVVELRFDPIGLRTGKAVTQIAQIKAGNREVVTWSVCGRLVGTYVLLARVTLLGVSIDSQARVLTITAGGKKVCP